VVLLDGTVAGEGLAPGELQAARLLRVDAEVLRLLGHLLHDELDGHLVLPKIEWVCFSFA